MIISGGGVGGIISAKNIQAQAKQLKPDLIVGTSVGSILGAWIALGNDMTKCVELFLNAAKEIFGQKNTFPPYYDINRIVKYLDKEIFKGAKVGDCKTPLMISAVDLVRNETTYHNTDSNDQNQETKIANFIRPSFSAPAYFQTLNIRKTLQVLSDGGVGYNNFPIMPAFIEMLKREFLNDKLEVYMFGSGLMPHKHDKLEKEYNRLIKGRWWKSVKEYLSPIDGGFARKSSYHEQINAAASIGKSQSNVTVKYYDAIIEKMYKLDSLTQMKKLNELPSTSYSWSKSGRSADFL
jgi:hypothetical protein